MNDKSQTTDHDRLRRMQERYDELRSEGKHGHYECMFRVWNEEFALERKVTNPHWPFRGGETL